ncbi:antibiotic biosynthesis monooxygenase [Arachidicoccus ginsenosidimutans]|uniref:putative quinol monooxygenase n=1 Tax=Arachidicoccus sp. BS20 TaxID=1850526 RepID=UPI0007F06DCA|nr:antibiotic biosynthesis monooxygenase [Arachidicoccus sp. BS20]ANI89594.1 antibiotic biosynthesis monooxygenase [Arachidicoccus sp. BS20]
MSKLALSVTLKAKAGKEKEVSEFLKSALPLVLAEAETLNWYAFQTDEATFGIFDTFENEDGRNAHLAGEIAKALMAKASELLAEVPVIKKADVLAFK